MSDMTGEKPKDAVQATAGGKAEGAVQDVFARQEDLFTVSSAKDE